MNSKVITIEFGILAAFFSCLAASLHSSGLGSSTAFWPANGFLAALLMLTPMRRGRAWVCIALIANFLLARFLGHRSWQISGLGAIANILEALLVAVAARRACGYSPDFTRLRTLTRFSVFVVIPVVIGMATLSLALLTPVISLRKAISIWPMTVMQEVFGLLMITPAMIVGSGLTGRSTWPERALEASALLSVLIGAEFLVLVLGWMPALFLVFPFIVAVSFRLGAAATGLAAISTSLLAFFFSVSGSRFGAGMGAPLSLSADLLLQLFVLAATGTALASAGSVAEQSRLHGEARRLAYRDQLTDLANRRMFTERLEQALARAARHGEEVALLLIDLDRFKLVNDTYGHQAGDELICEIARRLVACCRTEDVCARLGGDEFVVLTTGQGAAGAATLAQRLLERFAEPVQLSSATVEVSGSIGVALYSGGSVSHADLMRQVDVALYRVKEKGRGNFCFFETEMDVAAQNRRAMEADLKLALKNGDIDVAYQPQFEDEVMVGVEALARWTHPSRGVVSPAFFIPLAEECGLIELLGEYVLRRVFNDSHLWPQLRIAINLSALQLKQGGFIDSLHLLLDETGVDPTRFELELTEGVLLADDVPTQQGLAVLRDLGFTLALDDFGTGYSNLSYLRRLPIDRIKIDKSFVNGLPDDKVSEDMVRAIIRLAAALGKTVIAEGVETDAQKSVLSRLGCNNTQGFLMGRPVSAEVISGRFAHATPQLYLSTSEEEGAEGR